MVGEACLALLGVGETGEPVPGERVGAVVLRGGQHGRRSMTDDAERHTRLQRPGQQPAGVGVHRQILHRAVPARVEHRRVVRRVHVLQLQRMPELGHARDGRRHLVGVLLAVVELGGQTPPVHGRHHSTGGGDDDFVSGSPEALVRGDDLLRPEAGRVRGAVGQRPVVGPGHNEKDLCHVTSFGGPGRSAPGRATRSGGPDPDRRHADGSDGTATHSPGPARIASRAAGNPMG